MAFAYPIISWCSRSGFPEIVKPSSRMAFVSLSVSVLPSSAVELCVHRSRSLANTAGRLLFYAWMIKIAGASLWPVLVSWLDSPHRVNQRRSVRSGMSIRDVANDSFNSGRLNDTFFWLYFCCIWLNMAIFGVLIYKKSRLLWSKEA